MLIINRDGFVQLVAVVAHFPTRFDCLIRYAKTASRSLLFLCKKIGAVTARLFNSSGTPPFGDFRMVSTNKNFRNLPAPVFSGARVMRKVQKHAVCRRRLVHLRR